MNKKGFVVSAILYPLLVLFLALMMGLLAMSDTRKRILDKMKLEIADSIFDDAECSCDTILNKLNYIIKNGVGGSSGGSYTFNVLSVNVKGYETPEEMPNVGNAEGDIAVITDVEVGSYYVSKNAPASPKEGDVWIVQDITSSYQIKSDYSNIGISYTMQYIEGKWILKQAYVYDTAKWKALYYVPVSDGVVDLSQTNIYPEIEHTYTATGKYQTFTAKIPGYYTIELWGAQGGDYTSSVIGGKGAYASGEIYLFPGETLYIYVGKKPTTLAGGWNGGGSGTGSEGYSKGGGGATDIRLVRTTSLTTWNEFESLKSRIMVAAGGGGAGYNGSTSYVGGPAGALIADTAVAAPGATQVAGGGYVEGYIGNFGYAPTVTSSSGNSGGGGGGYYGGGDGWANANPGSGGSSYISGYKGCSSISETSTSSNILHNGSTGHYSGYYFTRAVMKAGNESMPTHAGTSSMTGNTGDGYAKITLTTVEVIEQREPLPIIFEYATSGAYQIFTAPQTGTYKIELWGATGGTINATYTGGMGGYTAGNIELTKSTSLYVYVGGRGSVNGGGWNGGSTFTGGAGSRGGGGSTDIRVNPTSSKSIWNEAISLRSRIMVAAGGGGAGTNGSNYAKGGAGGGLSGLPGVGPYYATGGTQIAGGNSYQGGANAGKGSFGSAGAGSANGAGGGGGWYGGGHGYTGGGGGGGGSSYISGHAGCIGVNDLGNYKTTTYKNLSDSVSYTNYRFIAGTTKMIDGNGFEWTTSQSTTYSGMPSPTSGDTITGNGVDGYAKITYLGN